MDTDAPVDDVVVDVDVPFVVAFEFGLGAEEIEGLPLTCPALATVPNDLTFSVLTAGVEAGEEEMGAETSSIDPNDTAESEEEVNQSKHRNKGGKNDSLIQTLFYCAHIIPRYADAIFYRKTWAKSTRSP